MTVSTVFGYNEVVPKSLDLIRDITPLPSWMNGISSYLDLVVVDSAGLVLLPRESCVSTRATLLYDRFAASLDPRRLTQATRETGWEPFLDWPSSENTPAIDAGLQSLMIQVMRAGEELCTVLGRGCVGLGVPCGSLRAIEFSLRKKSRFPSEKDRITPGINRPPP